MDRQLLESELIKINLVNDIDVEEAVVYLGLLGGSCPTHDYLYVLL